MTRKEELSRVSRSLASEIAVSNGHRAGHVAVLVTRMPPAEGLLVSAEIAAELVLGYKSSQLLRLYLEAIGAGVTLA